MACDAAVLADVRLPAACARAADGEAVFVLKPALGCCGSGIVFVRTAAEALAHVRGANARNEELARAQPGMQARLPPAPPQPAGNALVTWRTFVSTCRLPRISKPGFHGKYR